MVRTLAAIAAVILLLTSGCGSRCARVAAAREALTARVAAAERGADVRVADVRVIVPLARANELIAELLRKQPATIELDPPSLGPIELSIRGGLHATAREVRLLPGPPGKVRFAVQLELRDAEAELTTLGVVAEVTPVLQVGEGAAELTIQLGLEQLRSVQPELGADAPAALARAVARWIPAAVRSQLPQPVLEAAVERLGAYVVGKAYQGIRRSLLPRLGEQTRLRLRLPEVPVAAVAVRSVEQPDAALVVEMLTTLPIRQGLAPLASSPGTAPGPRRPSPGTTVGSRAAPISVELSGSATAELSNWAIDRGLAPRWYTRGLTPSRTGEFRPRFDYLATEPAHPFKVYAFQERGGCSYFRVGVRATVELDGPQLKVTAVDRVLERAVASPLIEAAAWVKYFLTGSLDQSKRIAARTRLTLGAQTLETEVVAAELADDRLRFELQVTATP